MLPRERESTLEAYLNGLLDHLDDALLAIAYSLSVVITEHGVVCAITATSHL